MKRYLKCFLIGISLSLASFAGLAETQEATLTVEHMNCATCPIVVRGALFDLEGVDDVSVSMKEKTVKVTFDNIKLSTEDLVTAVSNSGFPAKLIKS